MADLSEIPKLIGYDGKVIVRTICGVLTCKRIFEVKNPVYPLPDILICPPCQARMDEGIVQWIHTHSGRTKGGFHLTEGYTE